MLWTSICVSLFLCRFHNEGVVSADAKLFLQKIYFTAGYTTTLCAEIGKVKLILKYNHHPRAAMIMMRIMIIITTMCNLERESSFSKVNLKDDPSSRESRPPESPLMSV